MSPARRSVSSWSLPDQDDSIADLPPGLGYAGSWRRLAASLVDQTLVALAAAAFFGAMAAAGAPVVRVSQQFLDYMTSPGSTEGYRGEDPILGPASFVIWWLLILAVAFVYQIVSWSRRGSLGDRLVAVQIGNLANGAPLPLGCAFLRWVVLVLPFGLALMVLPLLPAVGSCGISQDLYFVTQCAPSVQETLGGPLFLFAFSWPVVALLSVGFGPRRQGFHDRVAGSAKVAPVPAGSPGVGATPAVDSETVEPAAAGTAQLEPSRPKVLPKGLGSASIGSRAAAYAIDALLLLLVAAVATTLLAAAGIWRSEAIAYDGRVLYVGQPDPSGVEALAVITLAVSVVYWLASWGGGASPGQRMISLQLGDAESGGRPAAGKLLIRWGFIGAPLWVQGLALSLGRDTWPLAILVALWQLLLLATAANSREGQGWHDQYSGTLVVEHVWPSASENQLAR